jgi:hypothetical protein
MADTSPPQFAANTERMSPPPADKANPAFSPPRTPDQEKMGRGKFLSSLSLWDISPESLGFHNFTTPVPQNPGFEEIPSLPGSPIKPNDVPSDLHIPDNYVTHTLTIQKHRPTITLGNVLHNVNWISFLVLTVTPTLAIYGTMTTDWTWKTVAWRCVITSAQFVMNLVISFS